MFRYIFSSTVLILCAWFNAGCSEQQAEGSSVTRDEKHDAANTIALSCGENTSNEAENKIIQRIAKGVVFRKGPHELHVKTKTKLLKYEDKPPHDEPLAGTHYHFCDRKQGFVLITYDDGTKWSGTLIDERTGAETPAGAHVLFSDDRRAYLASEQYDGNDALNWTVYSVAGDISWNGMSYIPVRGNADQMYAYLSDPVWKPNGELTAKAMCSTNLDVAAPVTLKKIGKSWDWYPKPKCPKV